MLGLPGRSELKERVNVSLAPGKPSVYVITVVTVVHGK